jgi:flagellar hook-associated protein 2
MNDLAVGGIMSGLDTNAIVNNLVANARKPLERYQKDIDMSTLEKEVYQNVFDKLGALDDAIIKLNLEGTYNTKKAISSRSSAVKATASINAETGNYEVEVKQVAENPTFNINFEQDPTVPLSSIFNNFQNGIITINGNNIYVSSNDSINTLIDKINNSGGGLKASFDENNKTFNIESTDSDNKGKIVIGGASDSSNLFSLLDITEDINRPLEVGTEGKPAIVVVDGREIESNTNEIKDAINGITLDVKNVSNGPINISVESNTDGAINAIADFIVQYNTLVEDLQFKQLTDQEKENLKPLTQEKRDSMTDKEIDDYTEKWEELNKNEIIRKSNELSMLYNDLRAAINTPVNIDGVSIKSLQDLGIEFVGANDYKKYPYLLVESTDKDEVIEALKNNNKLTIALEENPEEVYKFFAYQSDANQGFNSNIRNIIDKYYTTNGIIQNKIKAGGAIDLKIQEATKRMDDAQKRVDQELERYWKQFSAMEETIGQLQEQSNSLTNALAGMTANQM